MPSGTLRNFFLDTTVGDVSIDCLVHHLVEPGFEEFGSNSGTYCEGVSLPQRTGSIFYTAHDVYFRMSRSRASPLTEFFQFIQCEFTCQCQCRIDMGDMWPGSRKKRSRPSQRGFSGSYTRNSEKSTFIKSAPPMAPPGWPELAFQPLKQREYGCYPLHDS